MNGFVIRANINGLDAVQARLRGLADNKIKVAARAALNDGIPRQAGNREAHRRSLRPGNALDRQVGALRQGQGDKLESSIDFDYWGNKTSVDSGQGAES